MPGQDYQTPAPQATPEVASESPTTASSGPGNAATQATLQASGGLGAVPKVSRGGGQHTVAPGDTLWGIAERTYGSGRYWRDIMLANPSTVHDGGDLILIGDSLSLPALDVPDPSGGPEAEAPGAGPGASAETTAETSAGASAETTTEEGDAAMDGGVCESVEPVGVSTPHGSYLVYPDAYTSPLPARAEGGAPIRQAELDAISGAWTLDGPSFLSVAAESGEDEGERAEVDAFINSDHSVEGFSLGGSGNFDLTYTPTTSVARVEVRLAFNFTTGSVGGMIGAIFNDEEMADYFWSDDEQDAFKADFITKVHDHWSGAHELRCQEPDASLVNLPRWSQLKADPDVNAVAVDDNPHFTVDVQRIPASEFETSWVRAPGRDAAGEATGPGHAQFDSNDLTPTAKASGSPGSTQTPAVHEFGHMLGLEDEYPSSSRATGDDTRQGSDVGAGDNDDRIMSGGDIIDQTHYESIKQALNAATSPRVFDFA